MIDATLDSDIGSSQDVWDGSIFGWIQNFTDGSSKTLYAFDGRPSRKNISSMTYTIKKAYKQMFILAS